MNNVNNNIPVGVSFEYIKLEESIEYTILNGVFRKGEDFLMSSKSDNDVENDLIYPEM